VRKTVVILPPHRRSDEQVQRGNVLTPGQVVANGQPLGELVEHRVNDVDEGFVRGDEPVAPREQIAFEHPFHRVLTEHLHDSSIAREFRAIVILREVTPSDDSSMKTHLSRSRSFRDVPAASL
jgi:hypothetical protein